MNKTLYIYNSPKPQRTRHQSSLLFSVLDTLDTLCFYSCALLLYTQALSILYLGLASNPTYDIRETLSPHNPRASHLDPSRAHTQNPTNPTLTSHKRLSGATRVTKVTSPRLVSTKLHITRRTRHDTRYTTSQITMFLQKTNRTASTTESTRRFDAMRFTAILPLLLTLGAFILGMLCLFAGSKPGFMENYDIVTVSLPPLYYLPLVRC